MTTESNQLVLQRHFHHFGENVWDDIDFFNPEKPTAKTESTKELAWYKEHGKADAYRLIQRKTIHTLEETVIEQ